MSNSYLEKEIDPKKTKTNKISEELGIKSTVKEVKPVADKENIIQAPKTQKGPAVSNLGSEGNNLIAAKSANRKDKPKIQETKNEKKVAIFSSKNVNWEGVGQVSRGYNILFEEEANKWLTRSHVRLATPKEVAEEFKK